MMGSLSTAPGCQDARSPVAKPKQKLLDQLRGALQARRYSRSTEKTYCHWVRRFCLFHDLRHPKGYGRDRDQRIPDSFGGEGPG